MRTSAAIWAGLAAALLSSGCGGRGENKADGGRPDEGARAQRPVGPLPGSLIPGDFVGDFAADPSADDPSATGPSAKKPEPPVPASPQVAPAAPAVDAAPLAAPHSVAVRPLMAAAPRSALRSMHLAPARVTPLRMAPAEKSDVMVPLAASAAPQPLMMAMAPPEPMFEAAEPAEMLAGSEPAEMLAGSEPPEGTPEVAAMVEQPAEEPAERAAGSRAAAAPADSDNYDHVEVFYATDRAAVTAQSQRPSLTIPLCIAGMALGCYLMAGAAPAAQGLFRWIGHAGLLSAVVLGGYAAVQWRRADELLANDRVVYGNQRGPLEMGVCDVTIPKSHQLGMVETPTILRLQVRHDKSKHVVLNRVDRFEQEAFYQHLNQTVDQAALREVFVFVHGYNVDFDDAARRTAQLAYDLKYEGTPICYSWPSQGGLLKYTVDETNVVWTVPHLKQFLLDVVRNSGADSVNLVAHSMGNRALTAVLRELALELGPRSELFGSVVLAAPDVDAAVFRQMAPDITRTARHLTLYASSNDQALIASKRVHGYPRAGESGEQLVLVPGVETIDVSTVDTSFLGHSYYGDSDSMLTDLYHLVIQSLPARERRWLKPRSQDGLTYWVFHQLGERQGIAAEVARAPEPLADPDSR